MPGGGRALRPRALTSAGKGSPLAVLVVMCVGYLLVLLDVTIVNVALPQIGAGLGASVSGLRWVVDGYALALASLMLFGGTIGDLHGHKRVVLTGLVLFGLGSLACGLASSVSFLVAARVAQGVGAALLLPGTLAIISHAFPGREEQAKAIGLWAGIGSLALPAGPLLGGLLIDSFGWRAVFVVNVPIVAVSFAAAALLIDESHDGQGRRLDLAGVSLGALVLAATTSAVIVVERSRRDRAMLPLALFRRPSFSVANGVARTMNLCTLGTLFVLTLYLQSVQHRSPLAAGIALVPVFAPLALIAPFGGRLTSRLGSRLPMAAGLIVAAAGLGLLLRTEASSDYLVLLL